MRLRWMRLLACSLVVGCTTTPNTGLVGPSEALIQSTKDAGVYNGLDRQAVSDRARRPSEAIFESIHPSGADGGIGTTDWTYVRSVDLDYQAVVSGRYPVSPAVREFFRTCAPDIDPANPRDALRSGRVRGSGAARLVLTRITWRTEVGPGPNLFSTARVVDASLTAFGATARLMGPLSLKVTLSIGPGGTFGAGSPILEREVGALQLDAVTADCDAHALRAPQIPLGGSGWFPRGDVNNIGVEIEER